MVNPFKTFSGMISAVNTKLLMSATVKTPLHVSGCHIATMAGQWWSYYCVADIRHST